LKQKATPEKVKSNFSGVILNLEQFACVIDMVVSKKKRKC